MNNFKHSLAVCNKALAGKPEALFEALGDSRADTLEAIAKRAKRYEQILIGLNQPL